MRFFRAGLVVTLWMAFGASDARADYDMSGKWLLLDTYGADMGRLTITQTDGELSAPPEGGSPPWTGTIDDETGEFHLEATTYVFPMCSTWTIDGTVTSDGRSFTASKHTGHFVGSTPSTLRCSLSTVAVEGTRCGNTVLDSGEDCDLGDAADGDCCSSSCTYDAVETPCTEDGNDCTNDVCDGAGACSNVERVGTCVVVDGCGAGNCSGGTCIVSSSLPAGTPCDLDASVCTPDACDDSGTCVAGAETDCAPCGYCNDVEGCIEFPLECFEPDEMKVSLRSTGDPTRNSLKMTIRAAEFAGDPTMDLDLAVCLFEEAGGYSRPVLNVLVPAGPPWVQKNDQLFVYKDQTRANDGVSSMKKDWQRGFKVTAGRENLPLAIELPVDSPLKARVAQVPDVFSSSVECVEQTLVTGLQSDTKYKGSFSAAP
jgi:hypothetical protein